MKDRLWFVKLLIGLASLWIFYLVYIHVISLLSVPIGIIALLGAVFIIGAVLFSLFVNVKDFVVSIFKKDDSLDDRGFRKHL
ncbi:hypothetical protein KHA93_11575 [Bacillus sp. FJAT-49732]|uniref:Uncharacterized protein n=1 Tax=Lederbergia citrisecunda TaxID=2833583 RepID=A0A942YM34_9BACI|nr:hypothetical protein [Lederbergia citrisecunda]MBS4200270.1 hypothetical protein [Lederbergia citrisecunda]